MPRMLLLLAAAGLLTACAAPPSTGDTDVSRVDSGEPTVPAPSGYVLYINELMADNVTTTVDAQGNPSDWIELYNPDTRSLHVGGFYISDDSDITDAWALPPGLLIPAQGFLLLWADGDTDPEGDALPFKLSSDGERITLWDPTGAVVDQVDLEPLGPDQSHARTRDGGDQWSIVDQPTPGTTNHVQVQMTQTLLATGSVWSYRDSGSPPPDRWTDPDYDAADWSAGPAPLGYGDKVATVVGYGSDPNNKHITTWFRTTFRADEDMVAQPELLEVQLRVDDGALLMLNGVELLRHNLPTGPISPETYATATVAYEGETSYTTWSLPPDALVSGLNVLTAEVHQVLPDSSDIVVDASVTLTYLDDGS